MNRTIRMYTPIIKHEDTLTNIDVDTIFESIFNNQREKSFRKIEGYPTIIKKYVNTFQEIQLKTFYILKYRQQHTLYIGELEEDDIHLLTNPAIEITCILYDKYNKCIGIEFNREGHKEREFEKYINTFLPEGYYFELKRIYESRDMREILQSGRVRSLELRLNVNRNVETALKEAFLADPPPLYAQILDVLSSLKSTGNNLEANFMYWGLDLGRYKGTFDLGNFRNIIEAFNFEDEIFENAVVKYERNGQIEDIDLKKLNKYYTFKIYFDSGIERPTITYVMDSLHDTYVNENHIRILIDSCIHLLAHEEFDENNLRLEPSTEYKVIFNTED
ncbi:hypothetical protein M2102_000549 [Fusobacterium sp. PH5-7]|uniref:DUF6731 family protein n=1 Tax=Fusobacterium sp. PH5-7 TaxID=2940528 RepID=UPI00247623F0|nr:DUF6731 family protein [Fusobacterium sp. PH5-7]MDH6456934.1 hypothetical protein [Fusobacterium sp. PH5-7]